MLQKDAVLHLLRDKFPIRLPSGPGPFKHEPSPEEIEYRRELEAKPLFTLIAMIEALEPTRPIKDQVNTLVFEAFRNGEYFKPAAKPAIAAYRQRLEQMTAAEMAQHRANVLRGRGPSRAELWEPAHFFNLPTACAEFKRWAFEPLWSIGEAAALSFGREPSIVNWQSVKPYAPQSAFAAEFMKRLDRFGRAVEARHISPKMAPWRFVEWGSNWQVHFPPELVALIPRPQVETPAPAPTAPPVEIPAPAAPEPDKPKATTKQRAKGSSNPYQRRSPGPPLPFLQSAELATVFKDVDPKREWLRTTRDNKVNRLCDVERTLIAEGKPGYKYDPEGVALWLIENQQADRYKVARAMIRHIEAMGSDALEEKLDHWEAIRSK